MSRIKNKSKDVTPIKNNINNSNKLPNLDFNIQSPINSPITNQITPTQPILKLKLTPEKYRNTSSPQKSEETINKSINMFKEDFIDHLEKEDLNTNEKDLYSDDEFLEYDEDSINYMLDQNLSDHDDPMENIENNHDYTIPLVDHDAILEDEDHDEEIETKFVVQKSKGKGKPKKLSNKRQTLTAEQQINSYYSHLLNGKRAVFTEEYIIRLLEIALKYPQSVSYYEKITLDFNNQMKTSFNLDQIKRIVQLQSGGNSKYLQEFIPPNEPDFDSKSKAVLTKYIKSKEVFDQFVTSLYNLHLRGKTLVQQLLEREKKKILTTSEERLNTDELKERKETAKNERSNVSRSRFENLLKLQYDESTFKNKILLLLTAQLKLDYANLKTSRRMMGIIEQHQNIQIQFLKMAQSNGFFVPHKQSNNYDLNEELDEMLEDKELEKDLEYLSKEINKD